MTTAGTRRPASTQRRRQASGSRASTRSTATRRPVSAGQVTTIAGRRNASILTAAFLSLTLFGLVMVLSASQVTSLYDSASPYSLFQRQAMWAAVGAVAFVVASRIDYRWLRPVAVPFLVLTVILLIAVLIPGVGRRINGSSRWLGVGPFVVQPGEFAKLAIVLFSADLLGRRSKQMHRPDITIKPVMLIVAGLSALLLLQPKLGTTIVIAAVGSDHAVRRRCSAPAPLPLDRQRCRGGIHRRFRFRLPTGPAALVPRSVGRSARGRSADHPELDRHCVGRLGRSRAGCGSSQVGLPSLRPL